MTSTKRLKHVSMMLMHEDVAYVEEKLCQSHGDLSHIFRNVFANFVKGLKAQERANEAEKAKKAEKAEKSKKEKTKNADSPDTNKKEKNKTSRAKK
jgi:hypothetical protein